jgi:hypothetical protein
MFAETDTAAIEEDYTAERPKAPIAELAADAVERTDGDTSRGARILIAVLKAEYREFYAMKADESMMLWAQNQIRGARSALRARISNAPRGRMSVVGQSALSAETLRDVATVYMSWPVLPGVLLANAMRDQLREATDKYRRDSSVYIRRAGWLDAIADALPDDDTPVSEAMNEKQVAALAAQFQV